LLHAKNAAANLPRRYRGRSSPLHSKRSRPGVGMSWLLRLRLTERRGLRPIGTRNSLPVSQHTHLISLPGTDIRHPHWRSSAPFIEKARVPETINTGFCREQCKYGMTMSHESMDLGGFWEWCA
jgi:hypothetical protein